ncbi:MAG: thioredoxin family protein [Bacilli bacterium]|nr:thioredoxin family protein [Bacilli bacterium]MDD4282472.1 thioredoxin family protein [Bacilli bacterium]MDD4719044.1 thioredoxin family protein [Bacilli bacterium]
MKVLKFSAIWCPGCLIMRPIWNKVKDNYPQIEMFDYDYDSNNDEVKKWNIGNKLPVAIIINDDGAELTRIIGEKSKKEVISIIDNLMVK